MKTRNSLILAATSLGLLGAGAVLAQQSATGPGKQEIIRVEAPRSINDALVPQGRADEVFLTASVKYGDLDLTKVAGTRELQDRIETAATDVCQKLATMYPGGTPPENVCARKATDKAMVLAQAVIDKAQPARG
jgi:UrcA family protein